MDFYPIQTWLWLKEGNSVMWAGIVDQTIIGPYKISGVNLNSVNYKDS